MALLKACATRTTTCYLMLENEDFSHIGLTPRKFNEYQCSENVEHVPNESSTI